MHTLCRVSTVGPVETRLAYLLYEEVTRVSDNNKATSTVWYIYQTRYI